MNTIRSLQDIPVPPAPDPVPAQSDTRPYEPRKIPILPTQKRELVAGGDILWKPVDRVAARLLTAGDWSTQPPEPEPVFAQPAPVIKPPGPLPVASIKTSKLTIEASTAVHHQLMEKEHILIRIAKILGVSATADLVAEVQKLKDRTLAAENTLRSLYPE